MIAAGSGVVALVCGVLAVAGTSSQGELGLAAGVAGMMAGVFGLWAAVAGQEHSMRDLQATAELAAARDRQRSAENSLAEERRARAQLEAPAHLEAPAVAAAASTGSAVVLPAECTDAETPSGTTGPVSAAAQAAGGTLTDVETGLFSEAYFKVAVDARIASARRHLRPVAVALLQVVDGVGTSAIIVTDPVGVAGVIRETLRDADTACRLVNGSFALILEDTPENGAVWTVERIRRALADHHPRSTLWAGVACYPAHAFSTEELLEQGHIALEAAREWSQDRIEVATAE